MSSQQSQMRLKHSYTIPQSAGFNWRVPMSIGIQPLVLFSPAETSRGSIRSLRLHRTPEVRPYSFAPDPSAGEHPTFPLVPPPGIVNIVMHSRVSFPPKSYPLRRPLACQHNSLQFRIPAVCSSEPIWFPELVLFHRALETYFCYRLSVAFLL
jgi:hypothetical protein